MSAHRIKLNLPRSLLLLAALAPLPGFAADDATALLVKQARHWQSVNDANRAADAWRKLLQINPGNAEALFGLGMAEVARGNIAQANANLARLRQLQGSGSRVARLAQDIRLASAGNRKLLEDARALVDAGEHEKALAAYKRLFAGVEPQGEVALEYYSELRLGDPAGKAAAWRGVQRLAADNPGNSRIALYKAAFGIEQVGPARYAALRELSRLTKDAEFGGLATEQLRMGLSWLGTPPPPGELKTAIPLFRAYLAANPGDADVRKQLDASLKAQTEQKPGAGGGTNGWKPSPLDKRIAEGMRAMEAGDDAEAEKIFNEVLAARPNDANAKGGLGILRMRRGDHVGAEKLLAQAAKTAPGWNKALGSARYFGYVEQGNAARDRGDRAGARAMYDKAIALDGKQALAWNVLAALQVDNGEFDAATSSYRKALAVQPKDVDAWRGLVGALAESGQLEQAQQLLDSPPEAMQGRNEELNQLRAGYSAGVARAATRRGDDAAALQAWQEAVRLDPADPWHRLALAQTLMRRGEVEQAYAGLNELLQSNPGNAEAQYALATLDAQREEWSSALARLAKIPDAQRTAPMAALQRRAQFNAQIAQVAQLTAQGRREDALVLLKTLEQHVGDDAELTGTLAFAYADAGDEQHGLEMLKAQMAKQASPSPDLRMQYAGMLLKIGDDDGFDAAMEGLSKARLDGAQQASYQELQRLRGIRKADALREMGDLAQAESVLMPVLALRPDDSFALGTLARIRLAQKRPADAISVYEQPLQRDPRNLDLLLGAAQIAAQADELRMARKWADQAVAVAPDNAAVLLEAARIQRISKGERRASELYAATIEAHQSEGADGETLASLQTEQEELTALRAQKAPEIIAGAFVNSRDGTGGIGQMDALETPVEARFHVGEGLLTANATPVWLDAGPYDQSSYAAGIYGMAGSDTLFGSSSDHGVGYSLAYALGGLKADIGLTPRGFLYETTVGGLSYNGALGADGMTWYSLGGERRQVTGSLLSWAGARDPRDGTQWGGVIRNSVQAGTGREFGTYSVYAGASHNWFRGHDVRDNQSNQINAGINVPVLQEADRHLQVGAAVTAVAYDNNQNFYTFGHGGYFSPQRYLSLAVPVMWAQRRGALSYRVDASLGVQNVKQDGADYFPDNAALQAAAVAAGRTSRYSGSSSTGVSYNLSAAMEYKLSGRVTIGAKASMDNSSDYSQWNVGIYLRYRTMPNSDLLALPITPFRSPYAR